MRLVTVAVALLVGTILLLSGQAPSARAEREAHGEMQAQPEADGKLRVSGVKRPVAEQATQRPGTGPRESATSAAAGGPKAESLVCAVQRDGVCFLTDIVAAGEPGAPPPPDPRVLVQQAVLRMQIPAPTARVGPDPTVNEWKMAVVGYPLWLWTDGPDRHDAAVTEQGITLSLTARRVTTRFDLGDGAVKFCGLTTPYYWGVAPAAESPSCGYRYRMPSPKGGAYAVSATTVWEVTWSGLGQSGTLPLERTGPITQLPVGELVSVRTGD